MPELSFAYPPWFFLICVLIGATYAAALYWRTRVFGEGRSTSLPVRVMTGFRFVAASLISFLLLAPLLSSQYRESDPPIVVMMHDASSSIRLHFDQSDSVQHTSDWQALKEDLGSNYRLFHYNFGAQLREENELSFSDQVSDIAEALESTSSLFSNQNVGAVVMATDGIFNVGSNPEYVRNKLPAPLYILALGDTIPKRDILINRAHSNRIVYLDDRFEMMIDVRGIYCNTERSVLTITDMATSRVLHSEPVTFDKDNFRTERRVILDADKPGLRHYQVRLAKVSGEEVLDNNIADVFVEVLDNRQKILLLGHGPHPDLAAIKRALASYPNYEIEMTTAKDFKGSAKGYSLVVMHGLPSRTYPMTKVIQEAEAERISLAYILAGTTDMAQFNQAQSALSISSSAASWNDALPALAADFDIFRISDEIRKLVQMWPPLKAPFGEYAVSPDANVLVLQRLGSVRTDYPLMLVRRNRDQRIGVIAGEGLWRWRMYTYREQGHHREFDAFVARIVQFLVVRADQRRFRVSLPSNVFAETEEVRMDAELYNESYELVNDPDVTLVIRDESGKAFPFNFERSGNAYRFSTSLPAGNYSYAANTSYGGKPLTQEGRFSIQRLRYEAQQTTANHKLLHALAADQSGRVFYEGQTSQIAQAIDALDLKPRVRFTEQTRAFINLKWPFFVILILLAGEWFFRKWHGAY